MAAVALKVVAGGVEFGVWAKPRASKSRVVGVREGLLEVALAAPPVDGAANEELLRTLSSHFGVAARSVELVSGHSGRTKRVRIHGVTESALLARIPG